MASEKRKATVADRPAKRSKSESKNESKPQRANGTKHATATAPSEKAAKSDKDADNERRPAKSSILQTEEKSFPRGGADVLTPLERRQIKIDAERDVLFEQSGQRKPVSDEYGDDDDAGAEDEAGVAKKRKKSARRKAEGTTDPDVPHVKVQGLSYKNLVAGSLVLGQVTGITSRDVALALPNNLTGFIPLTAISERLNARIETLLAEDEKEKTDEDEDEDDGDIDLKALFHVGEFLRASITATSEESTVEGRQKSKRRIELSVDPRQANVGLDASELKANMVIQASVRSVEDHGLVMDLGLEDDTVRGFVSKKELGKSWELSRVQEGQVFLCCITGLASDGKVVKLSPDASRMGDVSKHTLSEASTINPFLPGTAVEVLVTDMGRGGMVGKIMGSLDATADIMHSGSAGRSVDASKQPKSGQKVSARVIATFPQAENKKVGVSMLDHIKRLQAQATSGKKKPRTLQPSETVQEAKVISVEPAIGLFLDLGILGYPGFAHISRLSESKIDALFDNTGTFKLESVHPARVLSFNPVDGVYNVSLEKKVLDQPFLRIEDVQVAQMVQGTVEKIILGAKGISGVLVSLAENINGFVPQTHMSDVHLQHPEKRFRDGVSIKARVLSVDVEKRRIQLTMKKTLLNSDASVWKGYDSVSPGDQSPGTIIVLRPNGAVVQFYGGLRGWLPVAEMSEAYIADPAQHFRVGQTVTVRAVSVNADERELRVSCKDPSLFGESQQQPWEALRLASLVSAIVTEVASDNISLDLDGGLKAVLRSTHMTDGSESKSQSALKQIRVGQKLTDLVVLGKQERKHLTVLSNKPSLIKAAKAGKLISVFAQAKVGEVAQGFVRNITPDGIFVEFAGGIVSYMPKSQITMDKLSLPAFGHRKDQPISARILSVDAAQQRVTLTLREEKQEAKPVKEAPVARDEAVVNAVDGVSSSVSDFPLGKQTQARIVSIKDTQLNVQLADNIQGRIDVSEAFEDYDTIKDRKHPLQTFKVKQVVPVKVLGVHDARNHRFLPITHRQSRIPVFELTAKTNAPLSSEADILTLDKVKVGSSWVAYVNNVTDSCLWVNLSPNVRGRVDLMDVSDDVTLLQDLEESFPIGSALKVRVKEVDASKNRLDLTATSQSAKAVESFKDLSVGMILPGKVFKVTERAVLVALSEAVNGSITLTEMADDLEEARPANFTKGDVVRVCVVDVDLSNKRAYLSVRPSKILSSALSVEDPSITALSQLKANTVVRGFVKLVRDNGIIVTLGPRVEAFVRVADLSDAYIKDWKSAYEVDQLVKGKILAVDPALNHVQLSLKASHVDKDYVPPTSWTDLKEGEVVTGKVRKVEDFGVFIDVDNTQPRVSGLCHRSQISDNRVADVKKLFDEGDAVKAKILSIDADKKRVSFGLKASYFGDGEDSDEEMSDAEEGVDLEDADSDAASEDEVGIDIDLSAVQDADSDDEQDADDMSVDEDVSESTKPALGGLKTSGFDWTGASLDNPSTTAALPSDSEADTTAPSKKRKRKPTTFSDKTGDLDANGPQSNADYERLLLTSPHSSALWIQYMAFQLRLSEVQSARDIGARALRTIHMRETDEKLAIWIALLNLEVSYGSPETVATAFTDACAVQNSYTMHTHLCEIYIAAARFSDADKTYESMIQKKDFRLIPDLWVNYATFLFTHLNDPARARALLPRALLSVHERDKRALTARFAGLEFKTPNADPERGRTIFEGLVAEWPRWSQGWDMWVDLERAVLKRRAEKGDKEGSKEAVERVRGLFERLAKSRMKKRRAKFVFKRWLEFEEAEGDGKSVERVKGVAEEYVRKLVERGEEGNAGED